DPLLAAKATYLASLIGTETAHGVMEKAAASEHPAVRVVAAAAAGRAPTSRAGALTAKLLRDNDPGVRKAALESVPVGAPPELHREVPRAAGREVDPHVHEASTGALRRLAGGSAAPAAATATPPARTVAAPARGGIAEVIGTAPRDSGELLGTGRR